MDIVKIQSLIAQGRLVELSDVDPTKSYLQLGIYQPGNRQKGASDFNTYAPFAIPLSELISGFKYEIGQDVPSEGGVIGHRWLSTTPGGYPQSGTVQNYLVVSYKDIGNNIWSNIGNILVGLTAQSQWDGQSNTNAIVAQAGATSGAAYACANLVDQGKSDWYLPSIQEFLRIWDNYLDIAQGLESTGANPILYNRYWTSTESTSSTAWAVTVNVNSYQIPAKSSTSSVRPIRKFSI